MSKKSNRSVGKSNKKVSNKNTNTKACFTPSPTKKASGYDFAARVSKCCLNWHEIVQKWDMLNNTSLEVATRIVNTQLQWPISSLVTEEVTAPSDVSNGLQQDKENLVEIFYKMKELHVKMNSLTSNFEAILSLHDLKEGVSQQSEPVFETWNLKNYLSLSQKMAEMFCKEVCLKEKLVGMVVREAKEEERSKLMCCLATWLHQPYVDDSFRQELEMMLLETGLKVIND